MSFAYHKYIHVYLYVYINTKTSISRYGQEVDDILRILFGMIFQYS